MVLTRLRACTDSTEHWVLADAIKYQIIRFWSMVIKVLSGGFALPLLANNKTRFSLKPRVDSVLDPNGVHTKLTFC